MNIKSNVLKILASLFIVLVALVLLVSTGGAVSSAADNTDEHILDALGLPSGDSVVVTTSVDRLTIRLDHRDGGYVDAAYNHYEAYDSAKMVLAGDRVYVYVMYPNFGLKRYHLDLPDRTLQAGYVYLGDKLLIPVLEK